MNALVHLLISASAILFFMVAGRVESQIPGKSILLNGQTDYVEIPDHNSLDITQNLTIEAWINPCSISDYNAIITKQWCNNSQLSYYLGLRDGYLEWAWDDDGNCSFSSIYRANTKRVVLNRWTHVAAVHSSSGVVLYLDGQQISGSLIQGSHSQIKIGNSPVRVGVYRNQSGVYAEFFEGRIDDVRIWNNALSIVSIQERRNAALTGNESGLMAYYPMEITGVGTGVTVPNVATVSGASIDGTTIGSPVTPSFVSTGLGGACSQECVENIGVMYGTGARNERGISVAATLEKDGFYVSGTREDSVLLIKQDLNGKVIWSRTFDIIPGQVDFPNSIIVDSEGMLAIIGIAGDKIVGGVPFVFRYNPQTHQILWAQQYVSSPNSVCYNILQKGTGGNYVVTFSPIFHAQSNIDAELLEINKNTGAIVPSLAKTYSLVHAESLLDITYDGQYIYGTGRYEDGGTLSDLRTVIVKLDPNTGNQLWAKMGHVRENLPARLYGSAIMVDNNTLVIGSYGDPVGENTSEGELFLQKGDLDGNILWCKQYELSGQFTHFHEMIKSKNGYVILASTINADQDIILLKTDLDGNLLWAKKYDFSADVNEGIEYFGQNKLMELNGQLIFTAYGKNLAGEEDLIIVKTNLEGMIDNSCLQSIEYPVTVEEINAEYYNVSPTEETANPEVTSNSPASIPTLISSLQQCVQSDTVFTSIDTLICDGESFLGYTTAGTHLDTFTTINGCDSIRTIQLSVITCQPECGVVIGSIYGDPDLNETADCLAATPEKDGMYVAGVRNQRVILMKLDLKGIVIWSKVFDIVQNKPEFVNCIMVDSDGNILLSGIAGPAQVSQGGTVYALKYDPFAHQVLWSKEYSTHARNYNNSIIQNGDGGNYMLSNNPHLGFTDDEEIIELDISTGDPVPSNTRNYRLMGSESVNLLYHEGFIYGVGRYTSNAATEFMRHTIVKIDPDDGSQLWVKMGHIGPDNYARLYGVQMVIDQDEIYSCYSGDPNGTSLSNTEMFVQKTNTSGTLRWVKQYDLPGDNDAVYAIAKSGNGLVLLAGQNNNSPGLNLFKIDTDGNLVWSKKIDFDTYVNTTPGSKAISKLIEVGDILAFTSISRNASGEDDMLIGRTDLNGESDIPCLSTLPVSISVINISNPQFYAVSPAHSNSSSQSKSASLNVTNANIEGKEECIITDTLYSTIVHSMCPGGVFEGYTVAGTYVDHFVSDGGCDSIRTLNLSVTLPSTFPVVRFCEGSQFENYNQPGFYVDTIPGILGCDTVRHLTLIETPVTQTIFDVTICSGAEYLGYNTEGIYTDTFQTTDGCDSVRILQLSVMNEIITSHDIQICLGDVYEGYDQNGGYVDTLQSTFGCDSIRYLQLTVISAEKSITVEVCEGGSFEQYSLPGQYIDTIQGIISACDTIRHITLSILPAEKTSISYTICAEDHFNGHTQPGEYTDTLTANDGCITIQTVMLSVREPITSYMETSLCDRSVPGHQEPGIFIDTLISSLGCDSVRTLTLVGPTKYIPNVFSPNNDGSNDLFEIFTSSDSHLGLHYFAIFDRFGDMTYETSEWPVTWDGNRLNGQPHQSGVYAYIFIYECDEERIIEHGNITLVR